MLQSDEELREAGVLSSTCSAGVARTLGVDERRPGDAELLRSYDTHNTQLVTAPPTHEASLTRPLTYQALELQLFDGRRTTDSPRPRTHHAL